MWFVLRSGGTVNGKCYRWRFRLCRLLSSDTWEENPWISKPWRWRQYAPSKHPNFLFNGPRVTSQKTWNSSDTAVKASNLNEFQFLFLTSHVRKIAKADYLPSSCQSVSMEQLGSRWTNFHEIWYLMIFRKSVEKIQVWLKSDKNNGYFTWRLLHIYDNISLNSS